MNDYGLNNSGSNTGKTFIKILAFIVYAAGAVFATLAFTNEIESFFPDSPAMNALAHIGAWANLFSVLLMLWAKDYWVTGTVMYWTAIVGWVIEVAIMALNVLASFGSEWAVSWTGLSPATPVFVIALWGLLWIMHPDHKARQEALAFQARTRSDFQTKISRAMQSQAVQDIMDDAAAEAARQNAERMMGVVIDKSTSKKTSRAALPSSPTVTLNADTDANQHRVHRSPNPKRR